MIHKTTRSILSVLLAALLLVTSTPLTPAFAGGGEAVSLPSESAEGRALEKDDAGEYQIGTAAELKEFAQRVNNGELADANAVLTANIDLSEICSEEEGDSWTPIGNEAHRYTGTFNGAGHTISGLYIAGDDDDQGLFGYVSGKVQNLSVSGSIAGDKHVGGVVGLNSGIVENCTNTGSVSGVGSVGGVVGWNDSGTVKNCYNTGAVNSSGSSVGGVVGRSNRGNVINCYNTGAVSGGEYVGGVVGWNSGSTVENCYNTGSVSGSGNSVGGVVGQNNDSGIVTNCYNTGSVSGSGNSVGGVVGQNFGSTVTGCYFLQQEPEISGIGNDSNATGAAAVNDLNDLCDALKGDTTNTWTISDTLKRPVLKDNHEDDGSEDHPYEIFTATQLAAFRDIVNGANGNPAAWAVLMENITLNSNEEWEPIGNSESTAYTGTFNGNGKTISGLNINNDYRGLFGYVGNTGTVQNLSVSGSVSGHLYVGGIAGQNNGNVINCAFSGSVSGVSFVGGVVGYNGGTVKNCYNTGSVSGLDSVGGVVGYNDDGIVKNCYNTGDVSGNNYVGGVVGYNISSTVENSYNTGTGTVSGSDHVGGVVGYNFGGTVENCYNTGSVTVTGSDGRVGGVVGYNFGGTVENCYNTGSVTVTGSDGRVGGVVGLNGGTVENCYNTGSVSGLDSVIGNRVGGVVGDNGGNVENCYNTGTVNVSGNSSAVGGVVGCNQGGSVQNCYNTGGVNVTGTGNWVGGVVGWNSSDANVTNCYNTGSVSGSYVGGVVGDNDSSVTNCYFLQRTAASGIGKNEGSGDATATEKDDTAFHSGEVAWLLQSKQTDESGLVWGQTLGGEEDSLPSLVALDKNAKTVYQVTLKYDHAGAQDKTYYTDDTATPAAPSRDGYTFGGWDKTEGEGNTITYTAKWTAEEPPYTGKYSYELSTSVGDHGSLTVDRYATEGDKVTIDVTPDQAYKLDELVVTANGKDVELTANGDGTFSFTMPSADVKISATFAEDPDWTEPEEPATDVSDLFSDIAPNAWYKDAVQYAYDNGLMTGVSANEFAPEQTTTRAMIVSILARLENVTTAEAAGFADVDDNDWYATAVNWAANVGVVNGYEDNTFQPNTAITREQLAAILMNYAAYKGEDVSNRADLTSYTDQPSTWATETMSWAVAEGLISGVTADTLQPQGAATRAQVAAILQRFLSE